MIYPEFHGQEDFGVGPRLEQCKRLVVQLHTLCFEQMTQVVRQFPKLTCCLLVSDLGHLQIVQCVGLCSVAGNRLIHTFLNARTLFSRTFSLNLIFVYFNIKLKIRGLFEMLALIACCGKSYCTGERRRQVGNKPWHWQGPAFASCVLAKWLLLKLKPLNEKIVLFCGFNS